MFIGEKPSGYFIKHPEKRNLGNFNATFQDKKLKEYVEKYLGQVYITDMVKTEGEAGVDFETEWCENKIYKKILKKEIDEIKPEQIVFLSKKTESLFLKEFNLKSVKYNRIYHPSYVVRYNKYKKWEEQFKKIFL